MGGLVFDLRCEADAFAVDGTEAALFEDVDAEVNGRGLDESGKGEQAQIEKSCDAMLVGR
jgi:hypothetical protein